MKNKLIMLIGIFLSVFMVDFVEASDSLLPSASYNLNGEYLISTSFLVDVDSGLMRVFYDTDNIKIGVEYYDDEFNIISKKIIPMELNTWGGFYKGTDAYYIVVGQSNKEEDDNKEVIRVIKYDKNWNRVGAARITGNSSLFGGEVRYPFRVGNVNMVEHNGFLYIVTGHNGYIDSDIGQGHQGFLMVKVDIKSMTGEIVKSDLWHSFAQHIKFKDNYLYVLEQSEGSRYTKITRYDAGNLSSRTMIPVLRYGGYSELWAIPCYSSVDDLEISDNNVLSLGTSIDQSNYDNAGKNKLPHNIYLTVTPINDFSEDATKIKWITNYTDDNKAFTDLKMVKINDNRFVILWQEYGEKGDDNRDSLSNNLVHYVVVDGNGNIVLNEKVINAVLSDCHPIYRNSKIVFYASSDNILKFYYLDVNTSKLDEKKYQVIGNDIKWEVDNGVLTISGTGDINFNNSSRVKLPLSSTTSGYTYFSNSPWLNMNGDVEKIVIKSGITSIGANSFKAFPKLYEVIIEDGVTSIGKDAFYGNKKLRKIHIPLSVTIFGEDFLDSGYCTVDTCDPIVLATIYSYENSYAINYAKDNSIKYVIYKNIEDATVNNMKNFWYTGKEIKQNLNIVYNNENLIEGVDYNISYYNNINSGDASVVIEGMGNFAGKMTKTFKIYDLLMGDLNKNGSIDLTDILIELKIYFGSDTYNEQRQIGDINGDGSVTLTDVLLLLKLYFSS